MSRYEETRLERCARRLGLDRNPLRRRMDRIEAVIRLTTMILLLVAVPITVGGRQADHLVLRQAHARRRQITRSPPSCSTRLRRPGPLIRTPRSRWRWCRPAGSLPASSPGPGRCRC